MLKRRGGVLRRCKAEILTAQLADFQPEGRHATVAAGTAPYGRMLPGIRGVRLTVLRADAKFKYDDADPGTGRGDDAVGPAGLRPVGAAVIDRWVAPTLIPGSRKRFK